MVQVIWMPYHDIAHQLPAICVRDRAIWRARTTIICYHIVQWHLPDRVLRQFGLHQHIPDDVQKLTHKKGTRAHIWRPRYTAYMATWNNRYQLIAQEKPPRIHIAVYMTWYWGITRRWIFTATEPPENYMPQGQYVRDMVFF